MKKTQMLLAFACLAFPVFAAELSPQPIPFSVDGRKIEFFRQASLPEWGYATPQSDSFAIVHPATDRKNAPLYVVLHSAGHDLYTCLFCLFQPDNHSIYHSPKDFYGLYLDCREHSGTDWWWGVEKTKGFALSPCEKRVMATVRWAIAAYNIDPERVYLSGNSMGGSGTLGIGMRHGDVFAAIKANCPAKVEHVSNRMGFPPCVLPPGAVLPDPPVLVDYSAQNDHWAEGHDGFAKAMHDRKYAWFFFWGAYGHANNNPQIAEKNDIIHAFDWLSVRLHEPYPVFTDASTDNPLPWPNHLADPNPGQVNGFFRWSNAVDATNRVSLTLSLVSSTELKSKLFKAPAESTATVTLRRVQRFNPKPGEKLGWSFGMLFGSVNVGQDGLITLPPLKITAEPTVLKVQR